MQVRRPRQFATLEKPAALVNPISRKNLAFLPEAADFCDFSGAGLAQASLRQPRAANVGFAAQGRSPAVAGILLRWYDNRRETQRRFNDGETDQETAGGVFRGSALHRGPLAPG